MTPAQCTAARHLLGWSRDRLGAASDTDANVVKAFEFGGRVARAILGATPEQRVGAIRAALEAAGVEFIEQNGGGLRVRLRQG